MDEKERVKMKERLRLINLIVDRAEKEDMLLPDRMSLHMDLKFVDEKIGLRLKDFLEADDVNFAHDIYGIQNNFNRETLEMDNFFLPRFAARKEA